MQSLWLLIVLGIPSVPTHMSSPIPVSTLYECLQLAPDKVLALAGKDALCINVDGAEKTLLSTAKAGAWPPPLP